MRIFSLIALGFASAMIAQPAAAQSSGNEGFFVMETREGRLGEVVNNEPRRPAPSAGTFEGGGFVGTGRAVSQDAAPTRPKRTTKAHSEPARAGEVGRPKALWNRHPNEIVRKPKRRYFTQWPDR